MMDGYVFHRTTSDNLPLAVGGEGPYIIDSRGKRYLDGCCGAAVSCLGHCHPEIVRSIKEQLDRLAYAHSSFFTTSILEELGTELIQSSQSTLHKAYFVSGGSEATEAALKLARQYFVDLGEPSRYRFIARRQSYHGNTLGALSVSGNLKRRQMFEPLLFPATFISSCNDYRERQSGESLSEFAIRVADELEHAILAIGPENVAAFIAETVCGATAGAVPAVPGYFKRIRDICDQYGVLLILDEVMCGMGRTGSYYAFEQEDIRPDIVTVAKGLGAGYQPIGATLVSQKIYETIDNNRGYFQHGHTYMGHATACAAAVATQRIIREQKLLENVRIRGTQLREALSAEFFDHPNVGDIRGRGLFLALEFVTNKCSREPFDLSAQLHRRIKAHAMDEGLLCYPAGGTVDGQRGDHVLIAPPFIITEQHVQEIVERLSRAVNKAIRDSF